MKLMSFPIALSVLLIALSSCTHKQKQDEVKLLFDAAGVAGTFVLADEQGQVIFTLDSDRAARRFSPASTFKIPNTVIALNAGVVTSIDSLFKWDGEKRWLDSWNQDQTLQSAFKVSCVWCYQEVARKIGLQSYLTELRKLEFGNQQIGKAVDMFWLDGSLKISAIEQVGFLNKLVRHELPYEYEHIEITKSIMFEETLGQHRLYGKTGWATGDINIGWYVGFVETKEASFSFALNMDLYELDKAPLRKALAIQVLRKLGVWPAS